MTESSTLTAVQEVSLKFGTQNTSLQVLSLLKRIEKLEENVLALQKKVIWLAPKKPGRKQKNV